MNLVPIGVTGELCVGGDGVGRGYLKRPDLTSERFVQNPYKPEERLYKSGDLARFLPNGDMEYLGRKDNQVKIRGFRVKVGEVQSCIMAYGSIIDVIVICKKGSEDENYLCAYFVADKDINVSKLREYLELKLPGYMVPAFFLKLDKMPVTSNGKINTKLLSEPNISAVTGSNYVAPNGDEKLIFGSNFGQTIKFG